MSHVTASHFRLRKYLHKKKIRRKEEFVLLLLFIGDAHNTFYLRLYGVGQIVKDRLRKLAAATTWADHFN